jgi:hypothetical protein
VGPGHRRGEAGRDPRNIRGADCVNDRWQAEMAPYVADLDGQRPDAEFAMLAEIFHLD